MFFEFFKKNKMKTLLVLAGFLVLAGLAWFFAWFYFSFFRSDQGFKNLVPAETAVYWQSDFGRGADDAWLWAFSQTVLSSEAAERTKILEEFVTPEANETALAILPGLNDFIFYARLDAVKFDERRERLENLNFHYIFENDKLMIANTRFGLDEVLSVMEKKNYSLADRRDKLAALNRAMRHSSAELYLAGNLKINDLRVLPWSSDFWSSNKLTVAVRSGSEAPRNLADFDFLLVSDDDFLRKNAENVLKDDLAALLPEIKEKKLPDGAVVKEILANPDAFAFEDKQIEGLATRYLSVPAIKQEFLIGQDREKVIIGNSGQIFTDYLVSLKSRPTYYGKNLAELLSDWLKWLTADFDGVVFGVNVK
jgi:hypothetical protein